MSKHPISNEELMAYLDGEAAGSAAEKAAAHLGSCRTCQEVAEDLESVRLGLRAWSVDTPTSADMPGAMAEALAEREQASAPQIDFFAWFRVRPVVTAMSLAVAVVLVGWVAKVSERPHSAAMVQTNSESIGTAQTLSKIEPEDAAVPRNKFMKTLTAPAAQRAMNTSSTASPPLVNGPLIVRNAELSVTAASFGSVQARLEQVLSRFQGYAAQLDISAPENAPRSLNATLRIPAVQLKAVLTELRRLGRVDNESQRGEDVTAQHIDLEARLANLRRTEHRLTEILATRTGKLADVLQVEEEIDRVRGQIETSEAEQKGLADRVALATIQLRVTEEYRQPLAVTGAPFPTRVRNAAVNGIKTLGEGVTAVLLWLLEAGPSLLLLALLLAWPARWLWRRRMS